MGNNCSTSSAASSGKTSSSPRSVSNSNSIPCANYSLIEKLREFEESDLIFRVFRFNRGIRDYRVAISQTKSASIVMFINPDTPNDLVNQVNKLTDKLVKAYNHKYKIKSTNLFKPSKFHALVNRPSKLN